jgi:FixJ family two-component response regulator
MELESEILPAGNPDSGKKHHALVDINLRGGERAHSLIDQLHDRGIRIVVISGYSDVRVPEGKVAAILEKPLTADLLLQSLRSGQNTEPQ